MCGICGWLNTSALNVDDLVSMNRRAEHRGPDGEGYWFWNPQSPVGRFYGKEEADQGIRTRASIGLGHRRLAILDLSDAGTQPMSTPDQKIWIVFNGEVYNYIELRGELVKKGYSFRTGTDTEVILAAYREWGTQCFSRFNGMWGLAVVDLERRKLILSRDRLGIKPLYTWAGSGEFAFASEIKQFFALPQVSPRARIESLLEYVDTGYERGPGTFFDGIESFPPGTWSETSLDQLGHAKTESYWNPEHLDVATPTRDEAEAKLRALFEDSVRLRLRSDVRVGVCLSGGLDSSAIFGQMQTLRGATSLDTCAFTAVYDDPEFDELPYAAVVLRRFGGHEFRAPVKAESFLEDFDSFIYHHDEPPGALSQYAAWSVMRTAHEKQVSVLLNGQGGDELFSGYWPAYYLYLRQARSPFVVGRHLLGSMMPGGNPELIRQFVPHFRQYLHRKKRRSRGILADRWTTANHESEVNWATEAQHLTSVQYRLHELRTIHLPRLLKWDDRNSMAFSIECRYPFLDFRLVEWVASLSPSINLSRGWNKLLIRTALGHLLPPEIQWRRSKIGFVTPQTEWIRTTLGPTLQAWVDSPSPELLQVIDRNRLTELAKKLFQARSLQVMNEDQFLFLRLFFLDRWLRIFKVTV